MNITRIAAGSGSGEPRSASSARQAISMQPSPAITHSAAPATSPPFSLARSACTCVHCEASPYTASPAATATSPVRSHGLSRRRVTRLSGTPLAYPGQRLFAAITATAWWQDFA